MSWLSKIAAPMRVTPEMDEFAQKAISELFLQAHRGQLRFEAPFFYCGILKSSHMSQQDRWVWVRLKPPDDIQGGSALTPVWAARHHPEWNTSSPQRQQEMLDASHIITINDTIPPSRHPLDLRKTLLHELIHCVDPKLNKTRLYDEDWHTRERHKIQQPGYTQTPEYHQSPWEQDAFMGSEAHEMVAMWKRNGVTLQRALEELQNHIPSARHEITYKENPKLWRRYMRAMWDAYAEIYGVQEHK